VEEVVQGLALRPGATVLDATVGWGGHAEVILEKMEAGGRLIGCDRDGEALRRAQERLERYGDQVKLIRGHFGELAQLLGELHVDSLDAALFDLGVSSHQLETAERGFSFAREGPLDMRMDPREPLTAAGILNKGSVEELKQLIRDFGQERWAGRIARAIVRGRPLRTTTELAEVVRRAVPSGARHGKIDPATRTFQAIRIAVNRELELLPLGLVQAIQRLRPMGRIAVLSYHSLEDRIVKIMFRTQERAGVLELLTRKPIRPSPEEIKRNPRARSARLRMAIRQGSCPPAESP
jgi:16S rRNA (cytosine1402-N4)-methyltransferase